MTGDRASVERHWHGLRWLWLALLFSSLPGSSSSGASHAGADTLEPPPLPLESRQPLLMFDGGGHIESGSGNGPGFPYPKGSPEPASASAFDSEAAPATSLVTARCWNNYETSDDCRDINVITDDSQAKSGGALNPPSLEEDSIITATLVYDAWGATPSQPMLPTSSRPTIQAGLEEAGWLASTEPPPEAGSTSQAASDLPPPTGSNQVHQNHLAKQGWLPAPSTEAAMDTAPPPDIQPAFTMEPVWRQPDEPLVATAKSGSEKLASFFGTPKPLAKSTTTSRICRDQNDADCDEADEDDAASGADTADDEADEEQRALEEAGATKTGHNQDPDQDQDQDQELGSGLGNPDDTEDDGDDDGDGLVAGKPESAGVWDMNGSSSSSNSLLTPQTSTTSMPNNAEATLTTAKPAPPPPPPVVTQGAEIEVVVHPMLPPSFPSSKSTPSTDWAYTEPTQRPQTTTTTTTTIIPDDTYKSKPVFPSTSKPVLQPESNEPITNSEPTLIDQDLATFKSVPIAPVMIEPESDLHTQYLDNNNNNNNSQSLANDNRLTIADRHKFEPSASRVNQAAPKFESAWLEKPQQRSAHPNNNNALNNNPRPMPSSDQQSGNIQQPALSIRRSSEMLPTLLVIASVLIFLAAMVVLVMMALWRRNMKRQRALLLSKSGLMNASPGGGPLFPVGQPGHHQMVASLHRPAGGLLSTYAPSLANKIGTSIVHRTPPADDQERLTTFADTGREDGGSGDNSNNSQQTCSTSTDNDETTSSGAGSMETNNNNNNHINQPPPVSQAQLDEHPIVAGLRQQPVHHEPPIRPASRQQQQQHYLADSMSRQPQQSSQGPVYPHPQAPMYPVGHEREAFGLAPPAPSSMQYHQMMQPPETTGGQMRRIMSLSRSVEALDQFQYQQHLQNQLAGAPNHNTMRPSRPYQPATGRPPPPPASYQTGRYGMQPEADYLTSSDRAPPFMLPPAANHLAIMNPSAAAPPGTRMAHHLTRAPYSTDDSSSFVTVSPSLARTSSSSSFALTTAIQPKPLVDAAGRMFNSYAPPAPHFGASSEPGASFVSAGATGNRRPPDLSEPWFV